MCLPVCHPLLQLPQQVSVELVQLGQVVQDLTEDPLIHHRLPILTGRLGNSIPEVLSDTQGEWFHYLRVWVQGGVTHDNILSCSLTGTHHKVPPPTQLCTCSTTHKHTHAHTHTHTLRAESALLTLSCMPTHTSTWKEAGRPRRILKSWLTCFLTLSISLLDTHTHTLANTHTHTRSHTTTILTFRWQVDRVQISLTKYHTFQWPPFIDAI